MVLNGGSMATAAITANWNPCIYRKSVVCQSKDTLWHREWSNLKVHTRIVMLAMNCPAMFVPGYFLGNNLDLII